MSSEEKEVRLDFGADFSFQWVFQTTVAKKKMFYNMRVKTLQRSLSDALRLLSSDLRRLLSAPHSRLRALAFATKEVRPFPPPRPKFARQTQIWAFYPVNYLEIGVHVSAPHQASDPAQDQDTTSALWEDFHALGVNQLTSKKQLRVYPNERVVSAHPAPLPLQHRSRKAYVQIELSWATGFVNLVAD